MTRSQNQTIDAMTRLGFKIYDTWAGSCLLTRTDSVDGRPVQTRISVDSLGGVSDAPF